MHDKRVLVTGAGSGIGRACAVDLANAGATVALLGRTRDELEQTHRDIGGETQGHCIMVADISEPAAMEAAYNTLGKAWSSLDAVVANAGVNGVWAPLDQLEAGEWDETFAINMRGTFLTVKLALPLLRPRGGSVVVVSSINGNRIFSNSGATAYACSKAAQVAFAKMIALELAKDHIRVNVVCPGAIETNIDQSTEKRDTEDLHLPVDFPAGDVPLTGGSPGNAEDVARVVTFLCSEAASHVSGTELYVDGAQSLLQG